MTKNNEVIAEKPVPEQWRHQALGRLEAHRQYIRLYFVYCAWRGLV